MAGVGDEDEESDSEAEIHHTKGQKDIYYSKEHLQRKNKALDITTMENKYRDLENANIG